MSVAELHPEELFDKLVDGGLSDAERERLVSHLQGCAVCRFDYGARLDFQQEAATLQERGAPNLPLRPHRAPPPPAARRPPRFLVWGIAAALMICGSVALAALGERPWRALAGIFAGESPAPASSAAIQGAAALRPANEAAPQATVPPDEPTPTAREAIAVARTAVGASSRHPSPASTPSAKSVARALAVSPPDSSGARALAAASTPLARTSATTAAAKTIIETDAAPEPSGAAKLFAEANQARRAGQTGRASGLYHLLQEQYAGSSEAELSRVTLATLLLSGGDTSGALAGFERYLAGPSHALEAEALVGRARALERLGRRQLETAAWREVQHRFPGSVYARQAAERLTALAPTP